MSGKNQTAVEWLEIQLKKGIDYNPLDLSGYTKAVDKVFEDAKAMEKEQIIDAYAKGSNDRLKNTINDYYNETYGN